jgi:nitrogen fixation NifU-like protein
MSNDLGDLYQEVIIDHSRHPKNFRHMDDATQSGEGNNPLCGDQLTVYVKVVDGAIDDIAFEGMGCAISVASASLMTGALKGKDTTEAFELFDKVHAMLKGEGDADAELGKLVALSGVSEYPMRVKCASLAWHTARSVLTTPGQHVSTE